jgi:RNA polymerase sigma-70 factor, ECF subfamily
MSDSPSVEAAWRSHRPYLVNLAYQMLGDVGEAEDVAQDAFLRLSRSDASHIDDVRAWLTVVAGRLCLDQLRSARARHEQPDESAALDITPSREFDPADRVTLDDEVHTALLEVLRRLTPAERVAFVLHDVFQMPFDEIAETVGRPVGTCRQLARRARAKFSDASPRVSDVSDLEHQLVTEKFITACANGDLEALTAVLDPTVWGVATFLGDPTPPPQINHGRDAVAPNLLRFLSRGTLVTGSVSAPVVFAFVNRRLVAVLVLTVRDNLILKIEATVDLSAATRG